MPGPVTPSPGVVSIQGVLTDWGQSPQISCFAGNKQRQGEDLPNVLPVTCKREVAACVQAAGPLHTDRSLGHLTVTGNIAEGLNRTDLQVSRSERAVLIQVIQTWSCHHTGGVEQGIMLMSALAIELPCLETRI